MSVPVDVQAHTPIVSLGDGLLQFRTPIALRGDDCRLTFTEGVSLGMLQWVAVAGCLTIILQCILAPTFLMVAITLRGFLAFTVLLVAITPQDSMATHWKLNTMGAEDWRQQ